MNTNPGLVGRKVGMTQLFNDKGELVPVTVVEAGGTVVQVKREGGPDHYAAVQLGFGPRKKSRTTKAQGGHFAKAAVEPLHDLVELRLSDEEAGKLQPGQKLTVDLFKPDDVVDVIGTSKGRGFAGVMKRYHFKGFIRSHGTHEYFRHGGSIGTRLTPGHVKKNQKMPGHMGTARVTMQNLSIVKVDAENGLLYIRGGIPGSKNGIVTIRMARKGQ
jgi:large subunit ribosomal protein L3